MSAALRVIGVGPGDPELLTLKAVRIIKGSPVICVPKGREEGSSLALSIVRGAVSLDGKEIMEAHFPMMKTKKHGGAGEDELNQKWSEAAQRILAKLREGSDVAFLTLGDPAIYSTFFYLYDMLLQLQPGLNIQIVPGVSSINASAAAAKISLGLGNGNIAVLPANYMENVKSALEMFDTVVLMKVNRVLNEIVTMLEGMGLLGRAVCVSRVGMEDEIIYNDIRLIQEEELNYFSMLIVRK